MRRDSIFYALFQQSPSILFDLIDNPPPNANTYRFDSVAVKEPKFEIDGVFLPPKEPGIVYFCEVQLQKDECLYERLFSEAFLYFYRNRSSFTDWQAVAIYPSRGTEQDEIHPYRHLLNSSQVHRIYLNELGDIEQLPLSTALMVLTTLKESEAPEQARRLIARVPQESLSNTRQQAIIEMVATIMVYKFTNLSRAEVDAMLGLSLQETRVYREAKEEGRQEGLQEGEKAGEERGRQAGQLAERRSLLTLMLSQKFSPLPQPLKDAIALLSPQQLEDLAIALLNFPQLSDAETWLTEALHNRLPRLLSDKLGQLSSDQNAQIQGASLVNIVLLGQALSEMNSIDELTIWLSAHLHAE